MSQVIDAEFATSLVPSPMKYSVLLPDGYEKSAECLPVLFYLHGGNGNGHDFIAGTRGVFDAAWKDGRLPAMVVVAPSVQRSFYMDFRDGSQKWETLLTGPFLKHIRALYRVATERRGLYLLGISMGGMGGLRMAFKHPELFAGVAAMEPGIEPTLAHSEIKLEDRFWRSDELFGAIYGEPVDAEYWAANNPATIARKDPGRLIESGLGIYLEVGDEDSFGLDRGTEFLHRVLRDAGVPHEYHLVRGADHLGRTLQPRLREALEFIAALVSPPPPDPIVAGLRKQIAIWKEQANKLYESR